MATTIKIRNLGPIKDVTLELNKVNVFMGPQSSGKSTIAKVISMCQWVEKRFILDGFYKDDFITALIEYHNLEDTYIDDQTYIEYVSDNCKIIYSGEFSIDKIGTIDYQTPKIIYIPAERNFVASISNLGKYKDRNNNIMGFLYDWYEAKPEYSKENELNVPLLGLSFYHNKDQDKDKIVLHDGKEIYIQNSSSGIQSLVPLYLLTTYLTDAIYEKKIMLSPFEKEQKLKELRESVKPEVEKSVDKIQEKYKNTIEEAHAHGLEISEHLKHYESAFGGDNKVAFVESALQSVLDRLISTYYAQTQLIIEEPEQNLFPSTQRDLLYFLLRTVNHPDRDHKLIITTHSPYILYALNNCMMGYSIKETIPSDKLQTRIEEGKFPSFHSWINPALVSVWEIQSDGTIRSIKDERTKTISKHYFNQVMNEIMDEYYIMLNYFKHEK